jgi:hypothetical protein
MKREIKFCVTWIFLRLQFVTATFDPDIVQRPGGSLIAFFLSLNVTVRSFLLADTVRAVTYKR